MIVILMMVLFSDPQIEAVSLDALEERLENGGDTTYVVNFWATWCKPCIQEMPAFEKLHRSSAGSTIKVIMVSLDDPEELTSKVIPFVKKKGHTMEVVLLNEDHPNEWIDRIDESWSGAIPATMLVDGRSGRRQFHEREFTFEELQKAVQSFTKVNR
jgi:thiol-disulfide isomerase/thioredoxin